ncbi:hypothetical protein AB0J82_33380 [Asanoa sp. NPDC049518]
MEAIPCFAYDEGDLNADQRAFVDVLGADRLDGHQPGLITPVEGR